MKVFKLLDFEVIYGEEFLKYNDLRKAFFIKSLEVSRDFEERCKECKENSMDIYEYGTKLVISTVEDYVIPRFIEEGLVSIDLRNFLKIHEKNSTLGEVYNNFKDIYEDDGLKSKNKKRINSSSQGKFLSKFTEVKESFFSNLDAVTNNISSNIKKGIMNNSKEGMELFRETLSMDIYNMHYSVIEVLKEYRSFDIKIYPSKEAVEEVEARLNNIKKYTLKEELLKTQLKEILELNPYEVEIYEVIIDRFGDKSSEVSNIAKYFNVDIEGYKEKSLEKYFDGLDFESEKTTIESKENFIKRARDLKVEDIEEYLDKINLILENFDIEERTVENIVFDTRKEAELAREDKEVLEELFVKFRELKENELLELKKKIEDFDFKTSIYEIYYDRVLERIDFIVEKKERESIKGVMAEYNLRNKENLLELINYIKSNLPYYKSDFASKTLEELEEKYNRFK